MYKYASVRFKEGGTCLNNIKKDVYTFLETLHIRIPSHE